MMASLDVCTPSRPGRTRDAVQGTEVEGVQANGVQANGVQGKQRLTV